MLVLVCTSLAFLELRVKLIDSGVFVEDDLLQVCNVGLELGAQCDQLLLPAANFLVEFGEVALQLYVGPSGLLQSFLQIHHCDIPIFDIKQQSLLFLVVELGLILQLHLKLGYSIFEALRLF